MSLPKSSSKPRVAQLLVVLLVGLLCCLPSTMATIYFHEPFDTLDGWITSSVMSDYGRVELSSGKYYIDGEKEKGLRLMEDAHFYAVSKELPTPIDNKDKTLVVSYSLKNEHDVRCAGAYLKFLNLPDMTRFSGGSPYYLMFGPDRCGGTRKLHIIFGHRGKNLLWKKNIPTPDDELTHVYTLEVKPDNTYNVYIDTELKESGNLDDDWAFLAPKEIDDPADHKPEDWVDENMIDDPEDVKPADWDVEPETIPDEEAKKPDNWVEEEDGQWERPMRPNPAYKGVWHPRRIENPAYKGPWKAKQIANPQYAPDNTLYHINQPITHVGIDVWQVEGGSIFDNIILGDNLQEVMDLVGKTYGVIAKEEAEMMQARHDEARARMEASRKAREEEEREL